MKSARRSRSHALRRSRAARAARRRSVSSAVRGRVATFASVDAFPSSSPFAAPFFFRALAARRSANARPTKRRVGARRRRDPRRREVTHPRSPPDGTLPREPNARESPTGDSVRSASSLSRWASSKRKSERLVAGAALREVPSRGGARRARVVRGSRPRHRRTPSIVVCAAPPSLAPPSLPSPSPPRARDWHERRRRFPRRVSRANQLRVASRRGRLGAHRLQALLIARGGAQKAVADGPTTNRTHQRLALSF